MRDKVVIITGASSGIGKALAYELAHQGAKVVLAARNIEELLHIEQDLRQQGAEVLSVRTDVTKELACKELIEQAYARFGRIDAFDQQCRNFYARFVGRSGTGSTPQSNGCQFLGNRILFEICLTLFIGIQRKFGRSDFYCRIYRSAGRTAMRPVNLPFVDF